MFDEYQILLIGRVCQTSWWKTMKRHIKQLEVTSEHEMFAHLAQKQYSLIIIDAGHIEQDVLTCMADIHRDFSEAKIVVVAAYPDWQRARAAFRAGAIDYLWKSMDEAELLLSLQRAIDTKPPPFS